MEIIRTEKYTLLKPTQSTVATFITDFINQSTKFNNQHIIIDFSEKFNIKIEELTLFLELSVQHRENGTSFVLIYNDVNLNDVHEEINIVPTLTEAIDILEMDAIERDLGF